MNRLWIWISAVIVGVVVLVTLFPFIYRTVTRSAFGNPEFSPKSTEGAPFQERSPEIRETIERRIWTNLSRTLAVGAVIGLIAGVLLTRWLVNPLRQLEQGAAAVARHQLDYRVPIKGSMELKSVARSFNRMAAELKREETLRRNMLADVTHELRHPVHLLQGNLQALLDQVYPFNMEEVNRLLEQTGELTALVNELYELTLAEAHELPLNTEKTDLTVLVTNTVETFLTPAEHKKISLNSEIPDNPIYCNIDVSRIRQVLQNLLGNALRYTPEGGKIFVELVSADNVAIIIVRDTGIGIAPKNLPFVFDRFYREDSSRNRDLPGTGLGLAIAQAIVQAHGGQIEAVSGGINKGSSFIIKLPLED